LIKVAAFFAAFLVLIPAVFGYVSVEIFPVEGEVLTLYPQEKAQFKIIATNLGMETIAKFSISCFAEEGVFILEDSQKAQSKSWSLENLEAGGRKEISFFVKPAEAGTGEEEKKLTVYYGTETYTNYTGTHLNVTASPLLVEVSLEKPSMRSDEENSVLLTLQNKGKTPIANITGELILPQEVKCSQQSFSINKLDPEAGTQPGERVENKKFPFTISGELEGEGTIIVRVQFEDEKGVHTVEKDISFSVQDKTMILYLIVLVVLLLVIIALVSRRGRSSGEGTRREKWKAEKEKTQAQE